MKKNRQPKFKSRPELLLDGKWELRLDPTDVGEKEGWFRPHASFPDRVRVPGCLEGQGFGKETETMRHHVLGLAWHRRHFTVPKDWSGKRIRLELGGVNRYAKIWIDDQYVGDHVGWPVAFGFDITSRVKPGRKHALTIAVDSRRREDFGDILGGCFNLEEGLGANWNGIYDSVRLECRNDLWLENIFVEPIPAAQSARVTVELGGDFQSAPAGLSLCWSVKTWSVGAKTLAMGTLQLAGGTKRWVFPIGLKGAPLWTPDEPNLLVLELTLQRNGKAVDWQTARFGQRLLEIRAGDFYLNGERFFIRGYGDDFVHPNEILPSTSKLWWREHLQFRKKWGFNAARHHSTMMPQYYLDAADEAGMFVQMELPSSYKLPNNDLQRDLLSYVWRDYIRQTRNHPSILAWVMSNEIYHGYPMAARLYKEGKELDPTRPILDADCANSYEYVRRDGKWVGFDRDYVHQHVVQRYTLDFWGVFMDYQREPGLGAGKNKFRQMLARSPDPADAVNCPAKPVVAHEMCSYASFGELDDIKRFTGVVKPNWLIQRREAAGKQKLSHLIDAMTRASQRTLVTIVKANIEACRRSPIMDGFWHWLLRDYWYATCGLLGMFDRVRGITPEKFRLFNSNAVPLWDREPSSFRPGGKAEFQMYLSDFRPTSAPLIDSLTLRLGNEQVRLLPTAAVGGRGIVGPFTGTLQLPVVTKPCRMRLVAWAAEARNEWPLWIFPDNAPLAAEALQKIPVLLANKLDNQLLENLAGGARVFLTGKAEPLPVQKACYVTGYWNGGKDDLDSCLGTMLTKHPCWGDFPHEGFGDVQMFNLIEDSHAVILEQFPNRFAPILWNLDIPWRLHWRGSVLEARVGQGCLLVSTLNMDESVRKTDPAADWLYNRFLEYAAGNQFQPQNEISLDWLRERIGNVPIADNA